jgi:glyoxylase-like metal-dependent hydrolase (beta-lactamase superfamily II)
VITLRGHTPGAVALALRDGAHRTVLLTGDSLFPGGPGRTTTPADFASLMTDLTERVFDPLADDTRVLPGHGDDTTLGAERPHLPSWWARGW